MAWFPNLRIAGWEPSAFRPLSKAEDDALVRRVNESGAGIIFLGLGCPLQEIFAYGHKGKFNATQICVGAAFDFHSGNKRMAPKWMQRYALEWFFRFSQEPRRLWRRYLISNTIFLTKLFLQFAGSKRFSS
jgi:exopolysaccharide biosynthesis WecB/TagA/CpsF family protein